VVARVVAVVVDDDDDDDDHTHTHTHTPINIYGHLMHKSEKIQ
jgi:hypothetical protein